MLSCSRIFLRQGLSTGARSLAAPIQLTSYIHTTHVNKDETVASGALIEAAKGMRVIPTRGQAAKEKLYGFVQDLCKQNLGEEGYRYFPFALGLFTTIGFCNVTNLLPYIEMPTQIIGCTVAMSTTLIAGLTIKCIAKHKLDFASFFFPPGAPIGLAPLLVPVETISFFSRAVSLGVRLGANLTAGHMILHIISDFGAQMLASGTVGGGIGGVLCTAALVPVCILEMAVAVVQAYVFCMLTTMYLNDAHELH
ncbi:hypothetical protein ACHWQZ_G018137 [Mnemiopsis leidyi]